MLWRSKRVCLWRKNPPKIAATTQAMFFPSYEAVVRNTQWTSEIPIWNQLGWKKNWKMSPRSQYLQLFKCRVRMFLQSLHRVDLYWSFLIVTLMLLNVIDLYLAKQYQKSVNWFVSGKTWRQTCYDALRLFPHVLKKKTIITLSR